MMMVPYMFHDSLLDDWFNSDWDREFDRAVNAMAPRGNFGKRGAQVMKTDVRETADSYEVYVELPGFKKEDVKLDLKDGCLTITASRNEDRDEKDDQGRYIRQERYTGSCARSFYVGEELKPEDVKARFQDGVLELSLPKAQARPQPEKKPTQIEIL